MAFIELIQAYPKTSIIIFSFLVTLFITLVTYFMTDRQRMREIKEKQKRIREEMKNHKSNPDKLMELQKEMMADLPEQMKHSFKPMLITLIPLLIVFAFFRNVFNPLLGGWWILYYIVSSMIFSVILRKVFKLQ